MATEKNAAERHAAGAVVKLADTEPARYALVVGYTDDGHPQLIDLPGSPREHQSGTERI